MKTSSSDDLSNTKVTVVLQKRRDQILSKGKHEAHMARQDKVNKTKPKHKPLVTANAIAKDAFTRYMSSRYTRKLRTAKHQPSLKKYADKSHLESTSCLLVLRNGQKYSSDKEAMSILKSLRLRRRWSAILLPNTPANLLKLRMIKAQILYGLIPAEQVRKLLTTKASLRRPIAKAADEKTEQQQDDEEGDGDDGKPTTEIIPLSTNVIVEEEFAEDGFICIEDLVNELVTAGPSADKIGARFEPFKFENLLAVEEGLGKFKSGFLKDFNQVLSKLL